jgi:SAM-dependent MidA family methyltransferase
LKSSDLKNLLLETIRRSGPITFEQYMSLCLYHPDFGYYTQGRERTGVGGDYFTSADLHPMFSRLIARQAAEMWEAMQRPPRFAWVEMGPGRGLFASDFLFWTRQRLPEFFAALDYVAVEPGPRQRRILQKRMAKERLPGAVRLCSSLEEFEPVKGCFFSNELVDAFPVAVVARSQGHLKEVYVTATTEELSESLGSISDPRIAAYVARYANQLEEGQRIEVNRQALEWIRSVGEKLIRGFVITIDYGALAKYLYSIDRPRGTLLAYRAHAASEDFLSAPGESDLTAHVNFSALIDAGKELGLEPAGFTTQEKFLMALGETNEFADLYDAGQNEMEKLQARLKLKRLISPAGMGNVFRVLIQRKGVETAQLTGLKYARS